MKLQRLLVVAAVTGSLAGCGEPGPVEPPAGTAPEPPADTAAKPPADTAAKPPAAATDGPDDTIVRHMHQHAAQLVRLDAALKAGDLEAAGTPAYWLSSHERFPGLPDGWGPHIEKMRVEAQAVEAATDLASARSAAARLRESCSGCHEANGLDVTLPTG